MVFFIRKIVFYLSLISHYSFNNSLQYCLLIGKSLEDLKCLGWKVVDPICRTLACNVKGMGAMAHIKDILISIQKAIEIISEKNQNQNQRDSDIFDSKVKKLEDDWREEIKRENAKENYDLFFSIVFSPISVCIVIALLIEFYGKNYFELT